MTKLIWPKIPPNFVRAVLAGHSALGLAFAALIYLVCFSGSLAVFAHEFHRWEKPAAPTVDTASPQAIQQLVTESMTRAKGIEHLFITPPSDSLPRLLVYVDVEGEDVEYTADAEGRIVDTADTPWTDFMTNLHINLHLPQPWGIFVVGLTGVALLSSLISGILAHPRIFRDAFHLRWGGAKRLQEADMHNRIGIWALPFHVIISLTGALLGLTTIIVGILALALFQGDVNKAYDLFLPPHPKDDPRPAPLPDLPAILKQVEAKAPGATITNIILEHPGETGQGVLIVAGHKGNLSRGGNYVFDGKGNAIEDKNGNKATLGINIIQAISTLHFGWFGGWAVKLAYAALGLALTILTASGVAIWLARRREKGDPRPVWERIWTATAWSQPVAFAAAALVSILTPTPSPLATWAIATLACTATLAWPPATISTRLRLATAILLLATASAHLLAHGRTITDPIAWAVDLAILLTTLALAGTVARAQPPKRVDATAAAE